VNKLLESFPREIEYKTSEKETVCINYRYNEEKVNSYAVYEEILTLNKEKIE